MQSKYILIVANDEKFLKSLRNKIGQVNQIILIPSGEEAIELINENQFNLAIVKHCSPEVDGPEIACKFRRKCPNLPIILVPDNFSGELIPGSENRL
ncbi:response regulator [candidate division KSB1 bacterium]|nr:response regulator [candidate division KSB1 bacterium]